MRVLWLWKISYTKIWFIFISPNLIWIIGKKRLEPNCYKAFLIDQFIKKSFWEFWVLKRLGTVQSNPCIASFPKRWAKWHSDEKKGWMISWLLTHQLQINKSISRLVLSLIYKTFLTKKKSSIAGKMLNANIATFQVNHDIALVILR